MGMSVGLMYDFSLLASITAIVVHDRDRKHLLPITWSLEHINRAKRAPKEQEITTKPIEYKREAKERPYQNVHFIVCPFMRDSLIFCCLQFSLARRVCKQCALLSSRYAYIGFLSLQFLISILPCRYLQDIAKI